MRWVPSRTAPLSSTIWKSSIRFAVLLLKQNVLVQNNSTWPNKFCSFSGSYRSSELKLLMVHFTQCDFRYVIQLFLLLLQICGCTLTWTLIWKVSTSFQHKSRFTLYNIMCSIYNSTVLKIRQPCYKSSHCWLWLNIIEKWSLVFLFLFRPCLFPSFSQRR